MNRIAVAIARGFGRLALPLAWYYAVAIALPFANGAALAGAVFVKHALVVLLVPPLLVALLSVAAELIRFLLQR